MKNEERGTKKAKLPPRTPGEQKQLGVFRSSFFVFHSLFFVFRSPFRRFSLPLLAASVLLLSACGSRVLPLSPGPALTGGLSRDSLRGDNDGQPPFAPHTLIIFYDPAVGKQPLLKAVRKMEAEILYDYKNFNGMAVRMPDSIRIEDAITRLRKVKGVLQVNRDRIYRLD